MSVKQVGDIWIEIESLKKQHDESDNEIYDITNDLILHKGKVISLQSRFADFDDDFKRMMGIMYSLIERIKDIELLKSIQEQQMQTVNAYCAAMQSQQQMIDIMWEKLK
jgi:hypothetical protein